MIAASGLAVVLATHNMELAARMDRRVTLRDGLVVELDLGGIAVDTHRCGSIARTRPALLLNQHRTCLTEEHNMNYVLSSFREDIMFRAVVEEAAALTSIALFLRMIAIWAQVLGRCNVDR